jgi:biotin carboxyl carrier protein
MALSYTLTIDEHSVEVEVWEERETYFVRIDGKIHAVSLATIDDGKLFSFLIDGASYEIHAHAEHGAYDLLVRNEHIRVEVERGHRHNSAARGSDASGVWNVRSPMTGIVAEIVVQLGDVVERGTALLILESMKMKNELRATQSGVVERVDVLPGQRVERGDFLVHGRATD